MKKNGKGCPGITLPDGAVLLGVVNEDGSVGFLLNDEIVVTGAPHDQYDQLAIVPAPGKHSRLNNAEESYSIIQCVMCMNDNAEPPLPDSAIRTCCSLFYRKESDTCRFCPYIITNTLTG